MTASTLTVCNALQRFAVFVLTTSSWKITHATNAVPDTQDALFAILNHVSHVAWGTFWKTQSVTLVHPGSQTQSLAMRLKRSHVEAVTLLMKATARFVVGGLLSALHAHQRNV